MIARKAASVLGQPTVVKCTGIKETPVSITYWIGSKRDAQSSYVDLGYDMTPGGAVVLPGAGATPAVLALEAGRQAFVKWIDEAYENDCRDASTKKFVC